MMKKINRTIRRKSMLYKSKVEYADYCMNHVIGCSHMCAYPCYAYLLKHRYGQVADYAEWCEPCLVENTLELLAYEIPRLKDKIRSVYLSFMTDPFMYQYPEIARMSLDAMAMLNDAGIKCVTLTKGVYPFEVTALSRENEYGITLVSVNEAYRERTESGASPYYERIASLKMLHDMGFKTWVSIEPYPVPTMINQSIFDILNAVWFVDKIVFGKLNYNKAVTEYSMNELYYNELARTVIQYCNATGKECHIKDKTLVDTEMVCLV